MNDELLITDETPLATLIMMKLSLFVKVKGKLKSYAQSRTQIGPISFRLMLPYGINLHVNYH